MADTVTVCEQGAGKWFPRMLQWADRQWRWRNPYTGHVMRYFDDTDIVTQLPDAFNFKPYWCARGLVMLFHALSRVWHLSQQYMGVLSLVDSGCTSMSEHPVMASLP